MKVNKMADKKTIMTILQQNGFKLNKKLDQPWYISGQIDVSLAWLENFIDEYEKLHLIE